ncbi:MAG: glycoside hydrolase family 130 protein [Bacteroidia bacterium]|nr:glycoside hydrolase family 130 protein [Bacteroidia bacterium]
MNPLRFLPVPVAVLLLAACQPSAPGELTRWEKPAENPILRADASFSFTDPIHKQAVQWQRADVFNPAAIVRGDRIYLLFRAEDNPAAKLGGRTSRIGLAWSDDGIHFTRHPEPVLYPDSSEWMRYDYPGGCEDPRVVQTEDSLYVMAYTSWNTQTARLSIAFSRDLIHWEKQGPAFARAYNGKFLDLWSKSGSIVTAFKDGRQVAARLNGKYWMYWGEQFVNLAWSDNLRDWYPMLDAQGELKRLIEPRPKHFDSHLTECGPPAVLLDEGIVLLYNGKNRSGADAAPDLPPDTYSVGKVVFDPANPERVLYRSETDFLRPTLPHEQTGQYKAGTTFAEGLVRFRSRWYLYYGTADSFVGLAIGE